MMMSDRVIKLLNDYNVPDKRYVHHYINFINKAYQRVPDKQTYQELHHIVPRSWGGDNQPDNLIRLTKYDHLIAHKILALSKDYKMVRGFLATFSTYNLKQVNSKMIRLYEQLKQSISKPVVNLNTGEIYCSARLASQTLGLSNCIVTNAIKTHQKGGPYYWAFKTAVDQYGCENLLQQYIDERSANVRDREVVNLNTLQCYKTAADGARSLGLQSKRSVVTAILQKCSAGGYYWQYKDMIDDRHDVDYWLQFYKDAVKRNHRNRKIVDVHNGTVYNSIKEMSVKLNVPFCTICNALKRGHKIRGRIYKELNNNEFNGTLEES